MPYLLTGMTPIACTFGAAPSMLETLPLPGKPVVNEVFVAATIEDMVPLLNILPFGVCSSPANPIVAAATAAAMGVLTPMPCIPAVVAPWVPPALFSNYEGIPFATVESRCICLWGGEISAVAPSQVFVESE